MNQTLRSAMCAALAATLVLGGAGCATVKKKFTRKKNVQEVRPVVYTEKEFTKPYTNDYYYTNNFNMWKVWHEELLKTIGGNAKSSRRAGEEAVARLKEMQTYLEEPKFTDLGVLISQVERAVTDIQNGVSDASGGQAKFTLEKTLRLIKSGYYTDDVKAWIKKDEIVL